MKVWLFAAAAVIGGGVLSSSGCHSSAPTSAATQPPLSVEAQVQQVEKDPHIPAAQKPAIEEQIRNNRAAAVQPPTATQ